MNKWKFQVEETPTIIRNCLINSHYDFPCSRGTIGCIVNHTEIRIKHYGARVEVTEEELKNPKPSKFLEKKKLAAHDED